MINEELKNKTLMLTKEYDNKEQELSNLKKQISDLALKETDNLSYLDLKNYFYTIKYYINYEIKEKIYKLLQKKKEEEYPEILDVHYYPCIKDMNFLTKEQQINLDKFLMKKRDYKIHKFTILDNLNLNIDYDKPIEDKIIEFLLDKGIIERQYIFCCNCGCEHETIFAEEQKQKFYNWHNFDTKNCTDEEYEEHEENYDDGFLFVNCWREEDYELSSIKEFEDKLEGYVYKIIAKPDMTLDNL